MSTTDKTNSIIKTARMAGFYYLILAICGGFAEFFVRQSLIVPGDAATTVNNIVASELLLLLWLLIKGMDVQAWHNRLSQHTAQAETTGT